jgi:hypothetical protein
MPFKRWLPTFLGFPVGGYLAFLTVGALDDPVSAAAGGLLAGAVIGAGQWLALRPRGMSRRWAVYTAAGMSAGTAVAAVVTGAGTDLPDVMLTGLVAGAAVGAAQSTLLARGGRVSAIWTAVTAVSWSLGWLVSSGVIDTERGFYVFGSSGAVLVTVLSGLTLRRILSAPGTTTKTVPPAVTVAA